MTQEQLLNELFKFTSQNSTEMIEGKKLYIQPSAFDADDLDVWGKDAAYQDIEFPKAGKMSGYWSGRFGVFVIPREQSELFAV